MNKRWPLKKDFMKTYTSSVFFPLTKQRKKKPLCFSSTKMMRKILENHVLKFHRALPPKHFTRKRSFKLTMLIGFADWLTDEKR